jgi:hypothetical protein
MTTDLKLTKKIIFCSLSYIRQRVRVFHIQIAFFHWESLQQVAFGTPTKKE